MQMRYVFNTSIIWAYDVPRVLDDRAGLFCACITVYHEQEHVRFVVLYGDHYPPMLSGCSRYRSTRRDCILFGVLGVKRIEN